MFDNRELSFISMVLFSYISSDDCPESADVKDEVRKIIRKIDSLIVEETKERG